jgi:WD40 repeat protein
VQQLTEESRALVSQAEQMLLRTLEGHSGAVFSAAFSPDGQRVVTASYDHTARVWNAATGQLLRTLEGHLFYVTGVAVSPDGRRAVSASGDNTLKVWDLETGIVVAAFTCDASAACCSFAGAHRIVAGDAGGRVYFLSLELERDE